MRYVLCIKMHTEYSIQINMPGKDKPWSEHKKTKNSINNIR